jgi:segregation and condensation protein B
MGKKKNVVTDLETTVDLTGSSPDLPLRDDAEPEATDPAVPIEEPLPTESEDPETEFASAASGGPTTDPSMATIEPPTDPDTARKHLRGLVEALVFAADQPIKANEIGKLAQAPTRQIKEVLDELKEEYAGRGIQLEEVAGGFAFRTNVAFAPFVRDLVGQKPVKLTRAQLETLAIVAYRQPITRPDIDDVRGVDCGPVLRTLLERDLVRILGKQEAAGRPLLYGTSTGFLELFGLKSLKDLPTLREFTELNEESKRTVEKELGETMETQLGGVVDEGDRPTMESVGVGHAHSEAAPAAEEIAEGEPANETEHAEEGALEPDPEAEPAHEGENGAEPANADEADDEGDEDDDFDDDEDDDDDDDDDDWDDDDEDDDDEDEDDDE